MGGSQPPAERGVRDGRPPHRGLADSNFADLHLPGAPCRPWPEQAASVAPRHHAAVRRLPIHMRGGAPRPPPASSVPPPPSEPRRRPPWPLRAAPRSLCSLCVAPHLCSAVLALLLLPLRPCRAAWTSLESLCLCCGSKHRSRVRPSSSILPPVLPPIGSPPPSPAPPRL